MDKGKVSLRFMIFLPLNFIHIRTTNHIESICAAVRLGIKKTKGCGLRIATLTIVFKLTQAVGEIWIRLKGYKLILKVLKNKKFIDGVRAKILSYLVVYGMD